MKKVFLCICIITSVLIACSKTNEVAESTNNTGNNGGNNGGANTACDTVNMKYATNVQPILQNNCYSCHGNGQVSGGVSLDNYTKVKAQVDNGKLLAVITHASGYPAMPKGLPKLPDCDINKIRDWINRGAANN